MKCNTDGLSKIPSPQVKLRVGGFSVVAMEMFVGILFTSWAANFAEFFAVTLVVELARDKGWNGIWFKMDSSLTILNFFNRGKCDQY